MPLLSMDAAYWRARWREGRIGFHQGRPNEHLLAHASVLAEARRILVPLCGKSVDLAYLAAHADRSVVGVELVEDAVRAFFDEQGLVAQRTQDGPFARFEAASLEVVVGDFFELGRAELGGFDGCFDRAALIALPPAMRPAYVAHLRTLLDPSARVLLVSMVHDGPADEPPFSVGDAEVRTLWAGTALRRIGEAIGEAPALRERGATTVREIVWHIELPP